ncbi:MAG: SOS response-associated peptidase [Maricaulaceae bacterium]
MCGRYALAKNLVQIAAYFRANNGGPKGNDGSGLWEWEPHYNIAPGSVVPVIAYDGQKQRKAVPMRWGLHPHWKKQPPEGRPMFNARLETAAEKPSFRTPFRKRRAIIPASGWYEWEGVERPKTPHYIHGETEEVTAFAGLWDQWRVDEGITLLSCTILTTSATGPIKHLHHRMPVRLPPELWDKWLDWEEKPDRIIEGHRGGDDLAFHEVSRAVNSGRAEGKNLIIQAVD